MFFKKKTQRTVAVAFQAHEISIALVQPIWKFSSLRCMNTLRTYLAVSLVLQFKHKEKLSNCAWS